MRECVTFHVNTYAHEIDANYFHEKSADVYLTRLSREACSHLSAKEWSPRLHDIIRWHNFSKKKEYSFSFWPKSTCIVWWGRKIIFRRFEIWGVSSIASDWYSLERTLQSRDSQKCSLVCSRTIRTISESCSNITTLTNSLAGQESSHWIYRMTLKRNRVDEVSSCANFLLIC